MTTTSHPVDAARPAPASRRWPAAVAAVAVLLLVGLGGLAFWTSQPAQYQATTTLVVLPKANAPEQASYFDTLSQGQVPTTFAQILQLRTTPVDGATGITAALIPQTSLVQLTATAPSAQSAETAADAALAQATPYFDQILIPYRVDVVEPAAGHAVRTGLTFGLVIGVVGGLAVVMAIAAYLAVRALQRARAAAHPQVPRRVAPLPVPVGNPARAGRTGRNGNGAEPPPASGDDEAVHGFTVR